MVSMDCVTKTARVPMVWLWSSRRSTTIIYWANGQILPWDATCSNTLAKSNVSNKDYIKVAEWAAVRKRWIHRNIERILLPFAVKASSCGTKSAKGNVSATALPLFRKERQVQRIFYSHHQSLEKCHYPPEHGRHSFLHVHFWRIICLEFHSLKMTTQWIRKLTKVIDSNANRAVKWYFGSRQNKLRFQHRGPRYFAFASL